MTFRNRTTLWLVLVISCVMLWDNWQVYNGGTSWFFHSSGKSQASAKKARAKANEQKEADQAAADAQKNTTIRTETVRISTDVVVADIDTAGGVIKRLELLKHKDKVDPSKNLVLFDTEAPRTYLAETGLTGGKYPSHKTAFIAKSGPRELGDADQVQLVLEAEQGGVKLVKTFTFKRGDYTIGVKHDVTNLGQTPIEPSLYLQLVRDGDKPEGESKLASTFTGPAVYTAADKFQKLDFEKIAEGKAEHANQADNGWIAMVQHYFVSAYIVPDKVEREIYSRKVDTNLFALGDVLPLGTVAPGATVSTDAQLYSGPQDATVLEKTAPGLELVRDYGWVTIIAKPIFWLMLQIQKVVGNWGWTIIWLTVLIKVLFVPLSAASYRSMANMKECQPKIEAIRERYKDDKPALNKAIMELYKTEKLNPLGGCLPVVIQIPVFIALYWVLLASVEIRNAPWLGWVTDLAAPDPWFILPIVMAVSMFAQQKMTPPPPDPLQAKVMNFVPIVFSIMFFFFPAGLVLYWVVNNLLSIAQQAWINKRHEADKSKKKNPA